MQIGTIYRHRCFYVDRETGELRPKYLIALARTPGGDIVARLLTSRSHGRREKPPCYHGDPYPGFYLGVPGGVLTAKTWVDLRGLEDIDVVEAEGLLRKGVMSEVMQLDSGLLRELLECAAAADDTTRLQERSIRDELARLG
jgi:hypothetical protein